MPEQTFEDAVKQLETIVTKLEDGNIPLEESLSLFEKGVKLSRFCAGKLDEAEKKVEILLRDKDGSVKTEPFESIGEKEDE